MINYGSCITGVHQFYAHKYVIFSEFSMPYIYSYISYTQTMKYIYSNPVDHSQNEQILLIRLQNLIHFIDIVYSNGNIIVPCVGSLQCVHFTSAISKLAVCIYRSHFITFHNLFFFRFFFSVFSSVIRFLLLNCCCLAVFISSILKIVCHAVCFSGSCVA